MCMGVCVCAGGAPASSCRTMARISQQYNRFVSTTPRAWIFSSSQGSSAHAAPLTYALTRALHHMSMFSIKSKTGCSVGSSSTCGAVRRALKIHAASRSWLRRTTYGTKQSRTAWSICVHMRQRCCVHGAPASPSARTARAGALRPGLQRRRRHCRHPPPPL